MSAMMSAWGRLPGSVLAGSPGRGRGARTAPVALAAPTGRGLMVKIGAGCGPGCRYKALINTAATPASARHIPTVSRGRPPKAGNECMYSRTGARTLIDPRTPLPGRAPQDPRDVGKARLNER